MRIIHAHKYYYLRAGAERYMLDVMDSQEKDGHQVVPFSMHYPKNDKSAWSEFFVSELKTETASKAGVKAFRHFKRALWSREAKTKFKALVDSFEPDIVHIHNLYTHISPSILSICKKKNIPVVMTVHDYALASANYSLWNKDRVMDLNKLGVLPTAATRFIKGSYAATFVLSVIQKFHRFFKCYEKNIDLFLANSKFTKSVLKKSGFESHKLKVLYPFTRIFKNVKYSDQGYVLFVGRLEKYKGVQTLINAMKEFPNTKLKIVGTGPDEKEFRKLAIVMKNVEFLGFVKGKSLQDLMNRARVMVVPSVWYEPFGLVVVESLAQMTSVIVSNIGGLKEIVEPGVSGEVFKPGDIEDLISKLKPFIQDSNHARSFAEAGIHRVKEISDPDQHMKELMDIYKKLIEKHRN